jgi:hypothetical protein
MRRIGKGGLAGKDRVLGRRFYLPGVDLHDKVGKKAKGAKNGHSPG